MRSGQFAAIAGALFAIALMAEAVAPPALGGRGGAVSTAAPCGTETALHLLEVGGNAVDAAVGAALALAVCHPQAGNLGGGGFAVVRSTAGEVASLDFRERAPRLASRDMYLAEDGSVDRRKALIGPFASGVPGSPAGLIELHRRFGSLQWSAVVDPAVRLARDGVVVTRRLHRALERKSEIMLSFSGTAGVFYPDGRAVPVGSTLRQPALAKTLERYRDHPETALRSDELARELVADVRAAGGIFELADLEDYQVVWREPVQFEAFGWSFASMDLPSSGGIILGTTLQLAERLGWEHAASGSQRAHLLAEIWRRAFADRVLLGDPETTAATAAELLEESWLARRAGSIDRRRATPSAEVGDLAALRHESAATTHVSIVDGDGLTVALTTTLNGTFGSGFLSPSTGILLNNEMDDFSAAPGVPNLYGLVQGEANAVRPGRRMLSSMTPTVAWREGEVLAIGTPGGSRIPTATASVLLWIVVDEAGLQEAVSRPRLHHQWMPDRLYFEPRSLFPESVEALRDLGHTVVESGLRCEVDAVRWFADGRVEAAADPRGPSVAGVVEFDPAGP